MTEEGAGREWVTFFYKLNNVSSLVTACVATLPFGRDTTYDIIEVEFWGQTLSGCEGPQLNKPPKMSMGASGLCFLVSPSSKRLKTSCGPFETSPKT